MFSHYTEVAFVEELFCTQINFGGFVPECIAFDVLAFSAVAIKRGPRTQISSVLDNYLFSHIDDGNAKEIDIQYDILVS